MDQNNPIEEWRTRWSMPAPSSVPPGSSAPMWPQVQKSPRSPWVYAAFAFGGTVAALLLCVCVSVGGIVAIALHSDDYGVTQRYITYRNDTGSDVWLYECHERCDWIEWWYWIESGDKEESSIDFYDAFDERIEWVLVEKTDATYDCIHIARWEKQDIRLSSATRCPDDIHPPNSEVA